MSPTDSKINSKKTRTINQTLQNLEQLQIVFGSAVSNFSEQLIKEATTLKELDKEVEGEKRNYELIIQSLEVTINNQQRHIEQLSQQLAVALKQVQYLAVKAIEGNSNRNSYDAIKEIALEQAKN